MKLTNNTKSNNKSAIGDKKTYGSHNIIFFWNANYQKNENIYHAVGSGLLILFIVFTIVFITTYNYEIEWLKNLIGYICFGSIFGFIICKWNEIKIRRKRKKDAENNESRPISCQ